MISRELLKFLIIKSIEREIERLDTMMKILNFICTTAHVHHSLYCHENGPIEGIFDRMSTSIH